jgi:PPOX class probable F420-dependent enzyme
MADEMAHKNALTELLGSQRHGILVTMRKNGRPQLSNVSHAFDAGAGLIRVSVTADRAKTKNLLRDPRASYHVSAPDFYHWVVGDGTAELTPVAADPHDATVDELVQVYRSIAGEHPNWDEYRAAMVADQRLVVRIPVERAYGFSQ